MVFLGINNGLLVLLEPIVLEDGVALVTNSVFGFGVFFGQVALVLAAFRADCFAASPAVVTPIREGP